MNCFYHPEKEAVGICKNCNKGLCITCVSEVTNGIACKGKCEQEVEMINELIQRQKPSFKRLRSSHNQNSILFGLLGIVFISIGLFLDHEKNSFWLSIGVGVIFLFGSYMSYSNSRKYK
jgi:hypothetical protein